MPKILFKKHLEKAETEARATSWVQLGGKAQACYFWIQEAKV